MANTLSQEEVDLLLDAFSEARPDEAPPIQEPSLETSVLPYDFQRPERFSKTDIFHLQRLFDRFAQEISRGCPPFLRAAAKVELTSIDQISYDEFLLSIPHPTSLAVLQLPPLEGQAVLEMNPSLVFPLLDRVLGGQGSILSEPRKLTDIENGVVRRISMSMLQCLQRSWREYLDFEPKIVRQESDPLVLQIMPGNEMIVLAGFEFRMGSHIGNLYFCLPTPMLSPILSQLQEAETPSPGPSPTAQNAAQQALRRTVAQVEAPLELILGHGTMTLREILNLHEGDCIPLDTAPHHPLLLETAGSPRFKVKIGWRHHRRVVQVVEVIPKGR